MSVIGVWRRSALGAGGVALLLPLGLALGVLLTGALGGGTALRALSQVFSGPVLPNGRSGSTAPGLESSTQVPQVPLAPRAHRRAATTQPVGAGGRGSSSRPGSQAPSTSGPHQQPQPHQSVPQPTSPSGGGSSVDGGAPSSPPPAAPAHSPVHQAAQQAADTVNKALPPAAAPAGDAVQTVVDLLP